MKGFIFFAIALLVIMEGIVWYIWKGSKKAVEEVPKETTEEHVHPAPLSEVKDEAQASLLEDVSQFPKITTEEVNGRVERTIHMGVRQYAWDPSTLYAKQGELVRLVVHNADVQHGLVIPELNVLNIDIPPEGAVIEFEAAKVGTFTFFCSYYCGEDHSLMRGKLIIEGSNQ